MQNLFKNLKSNNWLNLFNITRSTKNSEIINKNIDKHDKYRF